MARAAAESFYTFVGLRADGVSPTVDLCACISDAEALKAGAAWLYEHKTCAKVEVWRDCELVGQIFGEPASPGGRDDSRCSTTFTVGIQRVY